MKKSKGYLFLIGDGTFETDKRRNCALFQKELIRTGTWGPPGKEWTLKVTKDRIDGWIKAFDSMKRKGIKVPVPYDHTFDSKRNAGFVEKLWRENNRLLAEIEIPLDEDIERIGTTIKDVSVGIIPDFIDGKGNEFGEVIEHVALTTFPVVPSKDNFEKIAAGADTNREIITLSFLDEGNNLIEGEAEMLNKLIKLLGLKGETTEEDVCKAVETVMASKKNTVEIEKLKKVLGLFGEVSDSQLLDNIQKTQASLKTFTAKTKEAEKGKEEDDALFRNPRYLELEHQTQKLQAQLAGDRLLKINLALSKLQELGKITPAIRKEIDGGKILQFSRDTYNEAETEQKENMIKLFDMLPEGALMDMKERTKHFAEISNPDATKNAGIKLDTITKEKMADKKLSYDKAFSEAQTENPDLARDYATELKL
ncbi:MAG: hypothetical protein ACUZ77_05545 [Candidatus Brocadiales bacterium]